jgi:hypothetical protein
MRPGTSLALGRSSERQLPLVTKGYRKSAGRLAICPPRFIKIGAPMSAASPVRSLLATRPPEDLRHDRAAPARHRALPPSRCSRGWRAVCPATPETGSSRSASVRTASAHCSGRLRRSPGRGYRTATGGFAGIRGSCLASRSVARGPLAGGRGPIAAGWWSWHPACYPVTRHECNRSVRAISSD